MSIGEMAKNYRLTFAAISKHIERYARIWGDRFDQLDEILKE